MLKRLVFLPFFYLLLAGASCPGPEPFDCEVEALMDQDRDAKQRAPYYKVRNRSANRYIVTLRPGWAADLADSSDGAVTTEMTDLATGYGASDVRAYPTTRQFACSMTPDELAQMRRDARVLFVEQDGRKSISPLEGDAAETWGLDRIDQRDLPLDGEFDPGATGAAIHAYVIDTGIDRDHAQFEGRLGEAFTAFGDARDDDHGHGTHVAGTFAGSSFGVAREATIHAVRVLRDGSGADSDVIEGIDWVTSHVQANGWPAVANMSLGGDTSVSLDTAVCRSLDAGVVHVVAAGNDDGNACSGSPSHVLQAISVGATDSRDRRAFFSNQGECVDIHAPGVNILSSWNNGGTNVISGTSMASPHVAGVAALALERAPGGTPASVKAGLIANSTPDVVRDLNDTTANRLVYAKEQ